jgi:putative ABC transport system permease protein
LFARRSPAFLGLLALVMLLVAGREVTQRQHYRLAGWRGYAIGTLAMFISSFSLALLTLTVIIDIEPWYHPQYAIPLLGMLLGNTLNGVSLGVDRLTAAVWQHRQLIESRLALGEPWPVAIRDFQREGLHAGLTPTLNAMAAAGIVSLPGMMTGQILAGSPPLTAVAYQILIMFLIGAGSGCGTLTAVLLAGRRLFDDRHRLRLDRLREERH